MVISVPLALYKIDDEGCHLFCRCVINGKNANLLVDTGASRTVFDVTRIDKYLEKNKRKKNIKDKLSTGLGTNSMKGKSVKIDEFEIQSITYWNYNAILLDMTHVNQSYEMLKIPAIDGVLGSDFLLKHKAVINFEKRLLKLKQN